MTTIFKKKNQKLPKLNQRRIKLPTRDKSSRIKSCYVSHTNFSFGIQFCHSK